MKKISLFVLTFIFVMAFSMVAFADGRIVATGNWKQDAKGWWWQRTDGTYPKDCSVYIDSDNDGKAEEFCFDKNGYMLSNCWHPTFPRSWLTAGGQAEYGISWDEFDKYYPNAYPSKGYDSVAYTGPYAADIKVEVVAPDASKRNGNFEFFLMKPQQFYDYGMQGIDYMYIDNGKMKVSGYYATYDNNGNVLTTGHMVEELPLSDKFAFVLVEYGTDDFVEFPLTIDDFNRHAAQRYGFPMTIRVENGVVTKARTGA